MDARLQLLETIYRFDLDETAHIQAIQEAAARHWQKLGPVVLVGGQLACNGKLALSSLHVIRDDTHDYKHAIQTVFEHVSSDELRQCMSASPFYGGSAEAARKGLLSKQMHTLMTHHPDVSETLGFYGGTQEGGLVGLVTICNALSSTSPRERAHWQPVAGHLASAWRLRQRLGAGVALDDLTDAVFHPDGTANESRTRVHGPVRDRLREFVRRRESERDSRAMCSRGWPDLSELIAGRWTLIDRFEASGYRVVVALRNTPMGESLCRLTEREAEVLMQARRGASNKEIGLNSNLSASTVTRLLQTAMRKLNATLADVLQFSPAETIRCNDMLLGQSHLSVISRDMIGEWKNTLSKAETSIVSDVLRGRTNRDIAIMRGRSIQTVANQLASAFEKLGVHSRREMISRFSGLALAMHD